MILVLLGPPGAGKGTQAKMLARAYGVPHISTGDMFREHIARGDAFGEQIRAIMDRGSLVPDEITNGMVDERLGRPDVAPGFILDGFPRTTAQAEWLEGDLERSGRRIDRVLSFEVSEALIIERIGGRRSCPKCGTVYHVVANPPRVAGVCDRDGTALTLRDDDRPEKIHQRMQEYAQKTAPLKRFYADRALLSEVETVGSPEGVLAGIRAMLDRRG